jgi:hypothetical protein
MRLSRLVAVVVVGASLQALSWGCASWSREGLDASTLPTEVQPDYALFAQRCSKCHSLARPLTSGIDEDPYWVDYVARMRRQPASGIAETDVPGILRFLHYFSIEEKKKNGKLPPVTVTVAVPPASAPAASTTITVTPVVPSAPPAPSAAPPVAPALPGTSLGGAKL